MRRSLVQRKDLWTENILRGTLWPWIPIRLFGRGKEGANKVCVQTKPKMGRYICTNQRTGKDYVGLVGCSLDFREKVNKLLETESFAIF